PGTAHFDSNQTELVSSSAAADAGAAAIDIDGGASALERSLFPGAESRVLRSVFSDCEVAVLDVRRPCTKSRRRSQTLRIRAKSAVGLRRDDLDHTSIQGLAGQRVAGQIGVNGQGPQAIGADVAAAAFGHFLVHVKH